MGKETHLFLKHPIELKGNVCSARNEAYRYGIIIGEREGKSILEMQSIYSHEPGHHKNCPLCDAAEVKKIYIPRIEEGSTLIILNRAIPALHCDECNYAPINPFANYEFSLRAMRVFEQHKDQAGIVNVRKNLDKYQRSMYDWKRTGIMVSFLK